VSRESKLSIEAGTSRLEDWNQALRSCGVSRGELNNLLLAFAVLPPLAADEFIAAVLHLIGVEPDVRTVFPVQARRRAPGPDRLAEVGGKGASARLGLLEGCS
jgi:hypothetical protein